MLTIHKLAVYMREYQESGRKVRIPPSGVTGVRDQHRLFRKKTGVNGSSMDYYQKKSSFTRIFKVTAFCAFKKMCSVQSYGAVYTEGCYHSEISTLHLKALI